jgi:hypothetical protein
VFSPDKTNAGSKSPQKDTFIISNFNTEKKTPQKKFGIFSHFFAAYPTNTAKNRPLRRFLMDGLQPAGQKEKPV